MGSKNPLPPLRILKKKIGSKKIPQPGKKCLPFLATAEVQKKFIKSLLDFL